MSCQKLTQNLHTSKMGGRMIEIQWLYKHLLLSGNKESTLTSFIAYDSVFDRMTDGIVMPHDRVL